MEGSPRPKDGAALLFPEPLALPPAPKAPNEEPVEVVAPAEELVLLLVVEEEEEEEMKEDEVLVLEEGAEANDEELVPLRYDPEEPEEPFKAMEPDEAPVVVVILSPEAAPGSARAASSLRWSESAYRM